MPDELTVLPECFITVAPHEVTALVYETRAMAVQPSAITQQ